VCVCVCVCRGGGTDNGNVNKAPLREYQRTHLSAYIAANKQVSPLTMGEGGGEALHSVLAQTEGLANRTGTQVNERGTKWLRLECIMNPCRTSAVISRVKKTVLTVTLYEYWYGIISNAQRTGRSIINHKLSQR
jgi:hypothetical protein